MSSEGRTREPRLNMQAVLTATPGLGPTRQWNIAGLGWARKTLDKHVNTCIMYGYVLEADLNNK